MNSLVFVITDTKSSKLISILSLGTCFFHLDWNMKLKCLDKSSHFKWICYTFIIQLECTFQFLHYFPLPPTSHHTKPLSIVFSSGSLINGESPYMYEWVSLYWVKHWSIFESSGNTFNLSLPVNYSHIVTAPYGKVIIISLISLYFSVERDDIPINITYINIPKTVGTWCIFSLMLRDGVSFHVSLLDINYSL